MDPEEIIKILKSKANPENITGMARFGINKNGTLGILIPELRKLAKEIRKKLCLPSDRHKIANEIFNSGIHEARILAGYIAEPDLMTEKEMDNWVKKLDSWDDCDQICVSCFNKTKFAYKKIEEWSRKKEEFVKRTAFSLMAALSVHDKKAQDSKFSYFLNIIRREVQDERNFVKKAVNWALRQIGKRNVVLNRQAIETAKEIRKIDSKTAKWIANNAIRELESQSIQKRLKKR